MKAFNIKNGIQFSCSLEGESWRQGDSVKGTLEISDGAVAGRVVLALGNKKKIKAKHPKAYTVVESKEFPAGGAQQFDFQLAKDCSIAETYLLFGTGDDLLEHGNLLLNIKASETIESFLEVLSIFYKFKTKKIKSTKDGFIEAVIEIPSAKEYANIVSLKIRLKLEGDDLFVKYDFVINRVNFVGGFTEVVKEKLPIDSSITSKEYLIYGSSFNQDKVKQLIGEVIEQVKKKQLKI